MPVALVIAACCLLPVVGAAVLLLTASKADGPRGSRDLGSGGEDLRVARRDPGSPGRKRIREG